MFIFLEGPDASGKSTLATKLAYSFQVGISRFSYPKTEREKENMFDMYVEFIRTKGEAPVVVDRCWYSERVYGKEFRGGSCLSRQQLIELEELVLENGGGMIIHCTAEPEVLLGRLKARGDDYIPPDLDLIKRIKEGYDQLLHGPMRLLPVVNYEIVF